MSRNGIPIGAIVAWSIAACAACLPGCAPPERNFARADDVRAVKTRKELMWFLATVADPGFAAAARTRTGICGETEYRTFADVGRRVPWAAERLRDFGEGAAFDGFARELEKKAGDLREAAARADGPMCVELALSMKKTCKGCHDAYR